MWCRFVKYGIHSDSLHVAYIIKSFVYTLPVCTNVTNAGWPLQFQLSINRFVSTMSNSTSVHKQLRSVYTAGL